MTRAGTARTADPSPGEGGQAERRGAGQGTGDTVLAFVTVMVGGLGFALPLADVLEVVRPPALVRVPLGPPGLVGLAQWHGTPTPVLDLSRALGRAGGDGADGRTDGGGVAARVVVVRHQGQPVGLLVDGMAGMIRSTADRIDALTDEEGLEVDSGLLAGVLRDGAVTILDAGALIDRQFGAGWRAAAPRAAALESSGGAASSMAMSAADEAQLVVFEVAGQEFALPVERVREILPKPDSVTRMAKAKAHLLGVMPLRDRLLPLVGLRALFGLGEADEGGADAGRRVVVVQTDGADASVGVVVDEVRDILRIARSLIDPVPPLLAREAEFEDLDGIARADGGRRLVSVLSAARMFRHGVSLGGEAEVATMDGTGARTNAGAGEAVERFVVFRLAGAEYGLPVAAVQEVLRRPDATTSLPNAPDFVTGVVTLRGAVLPLIDQRRLLHLPAVGEGGGAGVDRGRVVVVAQGEARVGLLVDGLSGLLAVPDSCIGPAPAVSEAQRRLIRRVATPPVGQGAARLILLMDPAALLDMDRLSALLASV
ncbi:chemotaxis protein CheW [Azospirillum doebereinerae]|uniref:chemotaxis protein CheW n=1 Tax=Azospirillum doebereinerae TaxID=92933 RepID=UPI001EE5E1F3|nr:chemotaxis protein CheW [Azospirillum doebereinerae]MCG5242350.1 chemotaxis protein CheW [Azospirillum doebereinerae]